MNLQLTRDQYESAYMRAVATFSLAVGAAAALQVVILLSSDGAPSNLLLSLLAGVIVGIIAIIIAGMASAILTLALGIVLTVAVTRLLRAVTSRWIHLATYFTIGVVAALVPVGLFVWAELASESRRQFDGDWLTILDLVVALLLAGSSTALAWNHALGHPATVEVEDESGARVSA